MRDFAGRTAVITGAGSGFGLEVSRLGAGLGMNLVLVDVQADALDTCAAEMRALGATLLAQRVNVADAAQMEGLAAAVASRFGAPHLVFNNAGVSAGGLIWENSTEDWQWVLGVNLMGVVHGVRVFTPMMLRAARADAGYRGHIVNTASGAGLVNRPTMGVYSASKHAVVSISETLYQDLRLVTDQIGASVLCPFFIPTGILASERNRPGADPRAGRTLTPAQRIGEALAERAMAAETLSAADIAQLVFAAVRADQFYIYSHPERMAALQQRMQSLLSASNPPDPFPDRPEFGQQLRSALRGGDRVWR